MTKKDFIALADELRGLDIPEPVVKALIRFCKSKNTRFDVSAWYDRLHSNQVRILKGKPS